MIVVRENQTLAEKIVKEHIDAYDEKDSIHFALNEEVEKLGPEYSEVLFLEEAAHAFKLYLQAVLADNKTFPPSK